MKRHHPTSSTAPRRGTVLILVLVTVGLLAFGALSFSERILVEHIASSAGIRDLERRTLAESGVEFVASEIERRHTIERRHRTSMLVGSDWIDVGSTGRVRIGSTLERSGLVSGVENESAKLNLNSLPLEGDDRAVSRRRLLALPEMTPSIADALLDWMDDDDEPSAAGAESSAYGALDVPRAPRQGRFRSLDELLLVRGVTATLLYGEDSDHDGILDPNEDDRDGSPPTDDGDGTLDRGWSGLLTVRAGESNLRADGRPRLNLNDEDLVRLYDALVVEFDAEVARFVVAWRLNGSTVGGGDRRRREANDLEARRRRALARLNAQLGEGDDEAPDDDHENDDPIRGGINLGRKPSYELKSLYDVVGVHVRIAVDGSEKILRSPWPDDELTLDRVLPEVAQRVTVVDGTVVRGGIDVNTASDEVLATVPDLPPGFIQRLNAVRQRAPSDGARSHLGWLVTEGVVELTKLRAIAPYLTTGGDVVSGLSLGRTDDEHQLSAIRFTIDGTRSRAVVVETRDAGTIRSSLVNSRKGGTR